MKKTRKLKDIAEELLDKYKDAKTSVIWEYSFCIKSDIENLDDEIETYKKEIEKASEQEKSNLEERKMLNKKYQEMRKEAINDIMETLKRYSDYYCDLHNEVFNTDYYIIGTYQAKEVLREYDVFDAIEKVMNYEKDNFGEVYTDISDPEKLVNMLYYIIGDEIICEMNDISDFFDNWNNVADEETNAEIIKAMKELFADELEEKEVA